MKKLLSIAALALAAITGNAQHAGVVHFQIGTNNFVNSNSTNTVVPFGISNPVWTGINAIPCYEFDYIGLSIVVQTTNGAATGNVVFRFAPSDDNGAHWATTPAASVVCPTSGSNAVCTVFVYDARGSVFCGLVSIENTNSYAANVVELSGNLQSVKWGAKAATQ
ncbi:MAG: hypothetical protein C5B50_19250 [Verrucomicrobia bacterium]|nr:MAG: hypothetical protein C5B50_19250 [Verrucomicrobiota bacterium]